MNGGPKPFLLERYFARHEFTAPYLLCSSDCDGLAMSELLAMADPVAKRLWDSLTLGYTESAGLPLLRREIASLYADTTPDDVLVVAPQEGIHLAMTALAGGGHVVCTFPGYQSLYELAESYGCEVSRWEPEEASGWHFDVDRLESLFRPDTKLLIVNFPHNPTGALPSPADFRRIIALAERRNIRVFSDEMYRFLELDPRDRLPSACELSTSAITLFGMSKTYGLAGTRIGWLVTKDRTLRERLAELRDYTTICNSAPSEILALIGLRARSVLIARHTRRIERNLKMLDAFFEKRKVLFSWIRPKAGTVGFPGLLSPEPVEAFCDRLVKEAGVLLLPSTKYGYPASHVRVGFGRENLPDALAKLDAFLG